MTWLSTPAHARWLEAEGDRLLAFGRASRHPEGGFAWLDESGAPDLARPVELWVSSRMTHVYALGHLLGRAGCGPLVDHGLDALRDRFRDPVHGGWYARVGPDGPTVTDKTAYEHAFVVLAAASATAAGRPGADELLHEALGVLLEHFWDDEPGMVVEQWDESFTTLDGYRGVNANMHSVEALLAAADVLDDASLRARALRITTRVVHVLAAGNHWRIPEHFDASWTPVLEYNVDEPGHPFRPYGATIGHWLEWSRLVLDLRAALGDEAPAWLLPDARSLFDAAVAQGWAVDGADGFVYTVDWEGAPVVRERMHWVVAEATATAAALHRATGEASYAGWYETWWDHVADHFRDEAGGSWWHELSPANEPSSLTWSGKPDIYHAFQATLLPRLPLAPTLATALAENSLP
jgi:mannose/cellobiose epimerase-like protein (N-acyl-D-glucosamine 2-epimerase family)